MALQDYVKRTIDKFVQPKHGNNTEARRAAAPQSGYEPISKIPGDPGSTVYQLRETQKKREKEMGV